MAVVFSFLPRDAALLLLIGTELFGLLVAESMIYAYYMYTEHLSQLRRTLRCHGYQVTKL